VLSTAGAATAISCLSSRLIIRTCDRLRKGFYGRSYLYHCPLRPSPQPRSKTEFPEARLPRCGSHLRVIPALLIVLIDIKGQLCSDTTSNQP
jgi:hypothetical protein